MGTNYYVRKNHCECCGRSDQEYHIGKSSYGWAFTFQGYPWMHLTSWQQWKEFLKDEVIVDEYGEVMQYEKFVQMLETYKAPGYVREDGHVNSRHNDQYKSERDWTDDDGYSFTTTEFS
jgi:hypothetical protein